MSTFFTNPFSGESGGIFTERLTATTLSTDLAGSTSSSRPSSIISGSNVQSASSSPKRGSFDSQLPPSTLKPIPAFNHEGKAESTTSIIPVAIIGTSDFRRKSVDVGVLGLGYHRHGGGPTTSKKMREAVGPDASDKQIGVYGSALNNGKDRLLGRHLASILAHSLALCADPVQIDQTHPLPTIPGSSTTSPATSRNASVASISSSAPERSTSISLVAPTDLESNPMLLRPPPAFSSFPVASESKRFKLIGNLQSWTFNAMGYSSDELLSCVGIIFESIRNMEGVDFDLDRFKSLLISIRSAYHTRNGYHNFSHATDVTQALYTFLVRMGLAPPLYLLCEDDYDANIGQGRRKWRRNRAIEEGRMGELLRPMDVFALMVAAIGHDVGHPGLSNAYMVNAHTPVAQVYEDKSVLENFHTVTLMHMLRRHNFDHLLGGDFGHLGDQATSFRKILEASILATDMSRHFAIVNEINDMGRRFGERGGSGPPSVAGLESDRLLLCSGLMKCADISNPTRPHRISKAWSIALLLEWAGQAAIEKEFGLPVTVVLLDASDPKAQAESQVGFIDLFAKPLFDAMAGVVDEFADFAEKLRDGAKAWETISLQTGEAAQAYIAADWKLSAPPIGRSASHSSNTTIKETGPLAVAVPRSAPASTTVFIPASPLDVTHRIRTSQLPASFNRPDSLGSSFNSADSPISPEFMDSSPSSFTSVATHVSKGFTPIADRHQASDPRAMSTTTFLPSSCGGTCHTYTAMCETCSKLPENRRGSLGRVLAGMRKTGDDEEYDGEALGTYVPFDFEHPEWPPFPFRPSICGNSPL